MATHEINFDGIVGPTHNYAGLSYGNVASMSHKKSVSNPKHAALEGLAKMKRLMDLGVKQAVLPPHERPHLPTLTRLGFSGSDADLLDQAHRADPALLASVCSASAMWTANAATVSPSADTADGKVHFTPANLISQFHRSIEPPTTTRILRKIFADPSAFIVHDPLPSAAHLSDEGAANHMRLCTDHEDRATEVFVFGRRAFDPAAPAPSRFPARQTLEACQAIARAHLLDPSRVLFLQQTPATVDGGAFHNDVVAVANAGLVLHYQDAWSNTDQLAMIDDSYARIPSDMPLGDAVRSYVFNSQFVTLPDESQALIAPIECSEIASARAYIDTLLASGAIQSVNYVDVRQSMHNGGGPACLRLRVVLTDSEFAKVGANVFLTTELHEQLKQWIEKHYRDELTPDDLRDPGLVLSTRNALDELTKLLQLGSVYEFQKGGS